MGTLPVTQRNPQISNNTKHKMHSSPREANVPNSPNGQTDMINWFRNIHATSLNLKSKMVVQRKGRSHVTDILVTTV